MEPALTGLSLASRATSGRQDKASPPPVHRTALDADKTVAGLQGTVTAHIADANHISAHGAQTPGKQQPTSNRLAGCKTRITVNEPLPGPLPADLAKAKLSPGHRFLPGRPEPILHTHTDQCAVGGWEAKALSTLYTPKQSCTSTYRNDDTTTQMLQMVSEIRSVAKARRQVARAM